jgi:hypothetical protein
MPWASTHYTRRSRYSDCAPVLYQGFRCPTFPFNKVHEGQVIQGVASRLNFPGKLTECRHLFTPTINLGMRFAF